jgi:hypothetical protein
LASYFEAKASNEANAFQNYWNEDLARFWRPQAGSISDEYIMSKQDDSYWMGGPVPDGVLVTTAGIDTQDNGFYFAIVGYGRYMETWILRYGFIPCDMNHSEFKDPERVRARFDELFFDVPMKFRSGAVLPMMFGLIDEGGHRERDVQYICRKHHKELAPYKGTGKDSPLFRKSEQKRLWLCNTESLSKLVEKVIGSDTWHIPSERESGEHHEFVAQIKRQYTKETKDKNGNPKYEWVHGGEDHYRDCLNQSLAAAHIMDLPNRLNNELGIRQIVNAVESRTQVKTEASPAPIGMPKKPPDIPARYGNTTKYTPRSPFSSRTRVGRWR